MGKNNVRWIAGVCVCVAQKGIWALMFTKNNAGIMAMVLMVGLLASCTSKVQEQDALEFNYPSIRKARAKLREGDKQSALVLLNRAIDDKPNLAQAHLEVAQLYDNYAHNYVRAIYHYERYLELRPQTEKKEMIEGFIRKAKIDFAASVTEQIPGLDKKLQALQSENDRLKQDLRQVRENLARQVGAKVPPRSAAPVAPLGLVVERSGAPVADAMPVAGPDSASVAKPESASNVTGKHYLVQRGDTLSAVAARVYHNPRKWKLIYDANRGILKESPQLKAGQVLVIPSSE